ncbi:MAG: HD domain-containing phosphohydrolase [Dethiobacteria bacterium]
MKIKTSRTGSPAIPLAIVYTAAVTAFFAAALLARYGSQVDFWWPVIFVSFPVYFALTCLHKINRRSLKINLVLADHLQLVFPLVVTTLFLHLTGGNNSNFKILFLLPVIFYSLHCGQKWGHAVSLYSALVIFGSYFFCLDRVATTNLGENIFLAATFFLCSWFIGNYTELELSLRNQLTQKAVQDELTGFYRYQHFRKQLKGMIAAHDEGSPGKIGLILLNLENFKLYSKLTPTEESYDLLKSITTIINSKLTKGDYAALYGQDEFIIAVPCQKTTEVVSKAEKICEEIIACQELQPDGWNIYASAGIAVFPDHARSFQKLLQKADEALYKAKVLKENRVQLYYPLFAKSGSSPVEKKEKALSRARILLSAINDRDNYTYGHSERVLFYTQLILKKLRLHPQEKSGIEYAAFLHDIGKIKIPGALLAKPGLLTPEEQSVLRKHPLYGGEIIRSLFASKDLPALLPAVIHHHERFDGQGFPCRLKGQRIPFGARVIAVTNMFDNFLAQSPANKKGAGVIKEGIAFLQKEKGGSFDPHIVDTFVDYLDRYSVISDQLNWPEDLRRVVPAGYLPGFFLTGCHYIDYYSGGLHFVVKTAAYLSAALNSNEKCLYYIDEKSEDFLFQELYNRCLDKGILIRDKQLTKMPCLNSLWETLPKARFPLELKNFLKEQLDQAQGEGFSALRILFDGSALPLLQNQLLQWEKQLSRGIKGLQIVVICLYNIEQESPRLCRLLYALHDEPLLNRKKGSDNSGNV